VTAETAGKTAASCSDGILHHARHFHLSQATKNYLRDSK